MAQANLPANVRPFDWRDLPALYRLRGQSVFLNSALLLTRGPLPLSGALFSYLAPSMGLFTCVQEGTPEHQGPVFGQFIHPSGSPFAHLTFLAPNLALEVDSTPALLEYLLALSGERGALRMLADADERTQAYEALRRSGFVIYSRQRIWQFAAKRANAAPDAERLNGYAEGTLQAWRRARSPDVMAIRLLYNALVPGLVQQVEPLSTQTPHGLVYYQDGELLAYMEMKYGHRGIWVQPFIHPSAENAAGYFSAVLNKIAAQRSRPVYICVRSYQSWLEPAIEELGAAPGPRQAVMARQLVAPQKAAARYALPVLEGGQAEITAPLAHIRFEDLDSECPPAVR